MIEAEMRRSGLSLGELARRAEERFGTQAESAERRLRHARGEGRVMHVHTADRFLVLVNLHLTDVPTYRAALAGDLPPSQWPRRHQSRVAAGRRPVPFGGDPVAVAPAV
ncbi:MAG: hypothetical protein AB7I08_15140 [Thermoleophilia bacterium]